MADATSAIAPIAKASSALSPIGWAGAAISGLGALSGLFGGNKANDAYLGDTNAANGMANSVGGAASGYASRAGTQWGNFAQDDPAARAADQNLVNYYSQDPNTDARFESSYNNATSGIDRNSQTLLNNANASLAARGLGNSGIATGANLYLGSAAAGQKAGIGNDVGRQDEMLRGQWLGQASNAANGLASRDFNYANAQQGQADNLDQWGANYWQNQANQALGQASNAAQMGMSGISGLGSLIGSTDGFGRGYGMKIPGIS